VSSSDGICSLLTPIQFESAVAGRIRTGEKCSSQFTVQAF
jgi:hypothetical protein